MFLPNCVISIKNLSLPKKSSGKFSPFIEEDFFVQMAKVSEASPKMLRFTSLVNVGSQGKLFS